MEDFSERHRTRQVRASAAASDVEVRRERNARGQGVRLTEEIVTGALALVDREGTDEAVTLRAVAREIGIAAPSIYAHFPDRDAIVLAVVARVFDELRQAVTQGVVHSRGRPGRAPRRRLRGLRRLRPLETVIVTACCSPRNDSREATTASPSHSVPTVVPCSSSEPRVSRFSSTPLPRASQTARRRAPTSSPTAPRSGSRCTGRSACRQPCPVFRGRSRAGFVRRVRDPTWPHRPRPAT